MWWLPLAIGAGTSIVGGLTRYFLRPTIPKPPPVDRRPFETAKWRLEGEAQRWEQFKPSENLTYAINRQVARAQREGYREALGLSKELARRNQVSPQSAYARALQRRLMEEALKEGIKSRSQGLEKLALMKEEYRRAGREKASQLRLKKTDVDMALWQALEQRKMAQWQTEVQNKMIEYQALMDAIAGIARGVGGALMITYGYGNMGNIGSSSRPDWLGYGVSNEQEWQNLTGKGTIFEG